MASGDLGHRSDMNRAVALQVFGFNTRVYKRQVLCAKGGHEVELPDYCGSWDNVRPVIDYIISIPSCTLSLHCDGKWWKVGAYYEGYFFEAADPELPVAVCGVTLQLAGSQIPRSLAGEHKHAET